MNEDLERMVSDSENQIAAKLTVKLSDAKSYPRIVASIEGAWRLKRVMEYLAEYDRLFVPSQETWGPKEYFFEKGYLTIHAPDETESMQYDFSAEERFIRFKEEKYFISELTDNVMEFTAHDLTYSFCRIDPNEIHEKEAITPILYDELAGLWQVAAEYGRVDGQWQETTDFRKVPGIHFWKFYDFSSWYEYDFGCSPRNHGDHYKSFNAKYGIFRRYRKKLEYDFFHPVEDSGRYWIYVLDSMTGDYRDSRVKFLLTPIDRSKRDLFVESLLWAESERHRNTPAAKMPLDLLRLWAGANPEEIERLLLNNQLFDHPENYRTEEYAGAYVFLHYFGISTEDSDPEVIAKAYGKFHEVLNRWLSLYDKGKIIKYVYPFIFKKNTEQIATLQQAADSTYKPFIEHRPVTCEMLKKRLEEIRSSDHYLYALMQGLPKEVFTIRRKVENAEKTQGQPFTLHEFLTESETLLPDDLVSLNLFLHRDDVEKDINICDWVLYSNSIDLLFEFSTENLKNMFDIFLTAYCEKCLRKNNPFTLSPETIQHFGFTEEDVLVLKPRLDRLNTEAMDRIRKDYEALAQLDFIRAKRN